MSGLSGLKTYIIAVGMIVQGVVGLTQAVINWYGGGEFTVSDADVQFILAGMTATGLRHGITTEAKK